MNQNDATFGAEFLMATEEATFGGLSITGVSGGRLYTQEIYYVDGQVVFGNKEPYNPGGLL